MKYIFKNDFIIMKNQVVNTEVLYRFPLSIT